MLQCSHRVTAIGQQLPLIIKRRANKIGPTAFRQAQAERKRVQEKTDRPFTTDLFRPAVADRAGQHVAMSTEEAHDFEVRRQRDALHRHRAAPREILHAFRQSDRNRHLAKAHARAVRGVVPHRPGPARHVRERVAVEFALPVVVLLFARERLALHRHEVAILNRFRRSHCEFFALHQLEIVFKDFGERRVQAPAVLYRVKVG